MNIQKIMKQAQQMQKKMEEAQQEIAAMEVEGSAGGGMVKVVLSGAGEAKRISLSKDAVDPEDIEMLEDLIVAAINDARKKSEEASGSAMADVTGGMQMPPGFNFPG